MTARAALVSAALARVGWTSPAQEFLDLVAPGDGLDRQHEVARASDCGLVCLGIQEAVFDMPLRGPYRSGSAFALLYARAGGNPWKPGGAIRIPALGHDDSRPPELGDALVWGDAPGHPAHVDAVVVEVSGYADDLAMSVVAGGQRDAEGNETVKRLARTMRWDGRRWVDLGTGRPLLAVVDADAMCARYGMRETTYQG